MGFTQHLRARGEDGLAALLDARPELAAPPPASVRALAARAAGRTSTERTVATLDALTLQCLEAVLALAGTDHHRRGATPDDVARALGAPTDVVRPPLARLADLALVWTEPWPPADDARVLPAPGVEDVLGPYPAGLGPTLTATLHRRTPQALERLATDTAAQLPTEPADEVAGHLARYLADPATVERLLGEGPPAARRILEALTWGPPVGQAPAQGPDAAATATPARAAVQWLLRHGLLAMTDAQHAVLPRDVALVLRAGRTHREPALRPELPTTRPDAATVDADAARSAEELVRLTAVVLALWGEQPVAQVRAGGLGLRELRRLAAQLEVDEHVAALVVEVAAGAGLIGETEDPAGLAPTTEVDAWLEAGLPERWATLARAWLRSDRATWLVGSRDEGGTSRGALDPELQRPWVPRLRTSALAVLAEAAAPADQVLGALRWRSPRTPPPQHAVEAVLREAQLLGIVAADALSGPGAALLAGDDAAAALADRLPPSVGEMLLQGDLTGVVPGRPLPELAELVEAAAHVESRGAALTVRFTEESIRHALDTGLSGEDLLARLSRFARAGVPQPLEYLVLDVARRHGRLRIGAAASYVRADDPALLAGLVSAKELASLGLFALAPTVLAAQVPAATLLAALRDRGLGPVAEGPDGQVVVARRTPHRVRPKRHRTKAEVPEADAAAARERRLHRLAADLLAADRRSHVVDDDALDTDDPSAPVLALGLLREAAEEHRAVWLELVGPDGTSSRRRVRPLRVDAGRVRVLDLDREAELTVAVHRIVDVSPARGAS